MNGLQNIEKQFDEVITVDQRGQEKEPLSEGYKPGDRIWICMKETSAPYDSGTILRYVKKTNSYEVQADNKGNIFSLGAMEMKPYTNENTSLSIVRRNFMKITEIEKLVKEEIEIALKEMAAPDDAVPFVSDIPNRSHLINIPNNPEGKRKLEALKLALGDAYKIKLYGRAKSRATIPGATSSYVPKEAAEYWGVYLFKK
jgi:hypothetical protein